jgi:hypothetical protein
MLVNANKNVAEPGIDIDVLMKQVKFVPHSPGQHDYLHSKTRFNIPCCGRRWGKSQAAGHRATHKLFIPETYNWIVGPTYKLGEKEFRVVYNDFKKLGLLKHCKKSYAVNQGTMRIETPWDSVLEVVSAEKADSLLGEGLDHVIMSEAATHSRQVWEQFIEPALSDKLGTADFPSTPRGYNWYHGLYQLGQLPNTPFKTNDYASWTFPTWTNSARYPGGLDNAEIQRIKASVSQQYWDQEYGAKFTTFQGAIFPEFDESIHVINHEFNPRWQNFLAFDYGFANPFCCLDIQVDPNDNVYVWREYYARQISTYEHGQYLLKRENPKDYGIDGMFGDPRGANEAATLALMLGHVGSQDVPWKLGVEEIKRMLQPGQDKFPRLYFDKSCTNTIRQIEQLHVKERSRSSIFEINEQQGDGNIQHKVDDHAIDALRYFIGQYFVLGAGSHLADVYDKPYAKSEGEDFFRLHSGIVLDSQVRF